jgi:hypothetical protein
MSSTEPFVRTTLGVRWAVVLAMPFVLFAAQADTRPARPSVGAIRWDAWSGGRLTEEVQRTLGPAKYRDRLPWFAEVHLATDAGFKPRIGLIGARLPLGAHIVTLEGPAWCREEPPWTELDQPLAAGGLRPFDLCLGQSRALRHAPVEAGRAAIALSLPN